MLNNIKEIHLVFENCEYFTIPKENIIELSIGTITDNQIKVANGIHYTRDYDSLILTLDITAGLLYGHMQTELQLYKRLDGMDITHIDLIYEDDSHDYIQVPWAGDYEYINSLQVNEFNEKYIKITIIKNI